jgi:tetratricopeptide (TPR) repeat protein
LDDLYSKTKPFLHSFDTESFLILFLISIALYDQFFILKPNYFPLLIRQLKHYQERILFFKEQDEKRTKFEQKKYKAVLESLLLNTKFKDLNILWSAVEFFGDEKHEFSNLKIALEYALKSYEIVEENNFKCKIMEKCISLLMKPPNFSKENLNLANEFSDKLLEINNNHRNHYIKGSIFYREGNFEKALESFEIAISKNPKELLYHQEYR